MRNPLLSIPVKEFEFTDPDVARIRATLQNWGAFGVGGARRWLEPLLVLVIESGASTLSLPDSDVLVGIDGNLRSSTLSVSSHGSGRSGLRNIANKALKLKPGASFSSSRVPRKRAQERDEGLFFD